MVPKTDPIKHTPQVAFDLIKLAILDDKEPLAEHYLNEVPPSFLKKRYLFEANTIFLLSMVQGMERLALLILDKGFPKNVNDPIFTMRASKKYSENIPFRVNSSLFPSYFMAAIVFGHDILVKFMIKLGANVNLSWNGLTPLHVAAFYAKEGYSSINIMQTLLEFGADPWSGIYFEQYKILCKLKTAAIPKVSKSEPKNAHSSYVDTAFSDFGTGESFQSLVEQSFSKSEPIHQVSVPFYRSKQNLSASRDGSRQLLSLSTNTQLTAEMSSYSQEISSSDWERGKFILPLAIASARGDSSAVSILLRRMKAVKPKKPTAKHVKSNSKKSLSLDSIEEESREDEEIITYPQKDHFSLLHQQDLKIVIMLLKSGLVDIGQTDMRGCNALHYAVRANNIELVSVLLYFDTKDLVNSKGENGWTPLHEAISRKYIDIFRLLLKHGARSDIENDFGDHPQQLGTKLGLELDDIEDVWYSSLNRRSKKMEISAESNVNQELLFGLDPEIKDLILAPSSPLQRKMSRGSFASLQKRFGKQNSDEAIAHTITKSRSSSSLSENKEDFKSNARSSKNFVFSVLKSKAGIFKKRITVDGAEIFRNPTSGLTMFGQIFHPGYPPDSEISTEPNNSFKKELESAGPNQSSEPNDEVSEQGNSAKNMDSLPQTRTLLIKEAYEDDDESKRAIKGELISQNSSDDGLSEVEFDELIDEIEDDSDDSIN